MTGIARVLVTGGAGFIGARVTTLLLERGLPVTVLDDLSVGRRERVPSGARLVVGDILDPSAMREAVNGCDVVLHLAARVAIRSSFEFVLDDARVNYAGTAAVLAAAAGAGARRVVYASSMGVYADAGDGALIAETHPTVPAAPYGVSKLAGEALVHLYCKRAGMTSSVLRLFNTFGPGQQFSPYVGVVTIFVNRLRKGEAPEIFGDGEQRRDFVHVDDVAWAFVAAAFDGGTGQAYNIGSGIGTTVNDAAALIRRAMHSSVAPVYRPTVPGELRNSVADIGKARRDLAYAPVHAFATSVDTVVSDILQGTS